MQHNINIQKSAAALCADWCEDNLPDGSWSYDVVYPFGSPFLPEFRFSFDKESYLTIVALKFV